MRYFVPDIRIAAELGPQAAAQDKLGGRPWGLDPAQWPKCADCGKSQSLLAQLLHDPVRLDLGRDGRVLFVFQCNHDPGMCSTWEGGSGANACFVVEPERMTTGLTALPADQPVVENEARIVAWVKRDDGLPPSVAASFFDADKFDALRGGPVRKVATSTRLGGMPYWIQGPREAPRDGWRFVGQLDSVLSFLRSPKLDAPWVHRDDERYEGRSHYGEGPNFGDGGIAYLFLRNTESVPEGWFFWQCT